MISMNLQSGLKQWNSFAMTEERSENQKWFCLMCHLCHKKLSSSKQLSKFYDHHHTSANNYSNQKPEKVEIW